MGAPEPSAEYLVREANRVRALALRRHGGDVGGALDDEDVFFPVKDWPVGMRRLFYISKNNRQVFTLFWFLCSNGMMPTDAAWTCLLAGGIYKKRVTHLLQLVRMYKANPSRYSSQMMTGYVPN